MNGRRALTPAEERRLLRVVRDLKPRNRALITAQWLTGFRIGEILTLRVGDVWKNGALAAQIGIRPGRLKGGYGSTRWVPVSPELARALETHLGSLRRRYELTGDMPLFLSSQDAPGGVARPIHRDTARLIIMSAFTRAGIDTYRAGTHSLRKTWARRVYANSGNDIMLTRAALGHSNVAVTMRYLDVDEGRLRAAMEGVDFTRPRQLKAPARPIPAAGPFTQLELLPDLPTLQALETAPSQTQVA